MQDDFSHSLEDRELFLEFLKTGTVWGIYYRMSEVEIIEKFGQPDSMDEPDESSYFYYQWLRIGLCYFNSDNHIERRAVTIEIDNGSLGLFGLKHRNEDNASRLISWLDKRELIRSYDASKIRLNSGVTIEYQIVSTKKYAKLLSVYIESELKDIPATNEGNP